MSYVDDIELAILENEIIVKQINFRESICKSCNELIDKGYVDINKPTIFGRVLGNLRFSNYLDEKEVGEIIMKLKQYYDVRYTEAIYYVQDQVFYFDFTEKKEIIYIKEPIPVSVSVKPAKYIEENTYIKCCITKDKLSAMATFSKIDE